jgi:DNA-binding PadR family transcriptional regulator
MHSLTGFQRDLLSVVTWLDDANGQEIKSALEESQRRSVGNARLYANLERLAELEYVEKGVGSGRTNSYTPTKRGKREIEKRCAWEERYLSAATHEAT